MQDKQYSFSKILGIWATVTVPMGLAAWVVPVFLTGMRPITRVVVQTTALTLGLIWQFILTLIILKKEQGELSIAAISKRLWLRIPVNPVTGKKSVRMWLWLIPLVGLYAFAIFILSGKIDALWIELFPFLTQPPHLGFEAIINIKENFIGAWWFYILFLTMSLFNVFLGEGLLFHGILLPKMNGRFGKWDWLANGLLFALYHVHQPWTIGYNMIFIPLLLSLPVKIFKSNWMGIIIHALQFVIVAVFFFLLVQGQL